MGSFEAICLVAAPPGLGRQKILRERLGEEEGLHSHGWLSTCLLGAQSSVLQRTVLLPSGSNKGYKVSKSRPFTKGPLGASNFTPHSWLAEFSHLGGR